MHSRLEHDENGESFSKELIEEISEILNYVYKKKCDQTNKTIEIYGQTFKTELIMAVSVVDKDDETLIPSTYIVSADIGNERQSKILDAIVDSAGIFLEQFLNREEWDDYSSNWTEEKIRDVKIYYQITRENIKLSLLADQLLNQ